MKTFLDKNPEVITELPSAKKPIVSAKVSYQSMAPNETKPGSYDSKKKAKVENEVEDFVSTDGNRKQEYLQDIENILLELTNVTPPEDQDFHYIDLNNGCGNLEDSGAANGRLCKIMCQHKETCNRRRLVTAGESEEKKFCSDEYDLTPERDNQQFRVKYNGSSPFLSTFFVQDFLTTREIQTEDIPQNTTIVGAALISLDEKSSNTGHPENYDVNYPATNDSSNVTMEQITPHTDNNFKLEKEITVPANLTILPDTTNNLENEMPIPLSKDNKNHSSEHKLPIESSFQTDGTLTLASTVTADRTKQFHGIEEEISRKTATPLFSMISELPEISKDDSFENRHLRKVSILKNPVVQVVIS